MAALPAAAQIDLQETQKYVLLRVTTAGDATGKLYLRGLAAAEYHADVMGAFEASLLAASGPCASITCLGGGRVTFTAPATYRVHGYSVAFGRADHAASAAMLLPALPAGCTVSHDDEGY